MFNLKKSLSFFIFIFSLFFLKINYAATPNSRTINVFPDSGELLNSLLITKSTKEIQDAIYRGTFNQQEFLLRIAVHEAGHVLVGKLLGRGVERVYVSGSVYEKSETIYKPLNGRIEKIEDSITMRIAGYVAETLYLGFSYKEILVTDLNSIIKLYNLGIKYHKFQVSQIQDPKKFFFDLIKRAQDIILQNQDKFGKIVYALFYKKELNENEINFCIF